MGYYDLDYPKETSGNYVYNEDDIFSHAEIISGMKNDKLENKLLNFYVGDLVVNSEIDFEKFSKRGSNFNNLYFEKTFGRGYFPGGNYDLFADSPYIYLLKKFENIGAILSLEPRPNAIMVNQIQGFPFQKDIWGNLRYPDLLLDLVYNDFKNLGISEMWVLPHFRNEWEEVRDNFQNTKKRQYDIPAKRQGFEFNEKRGIWIKSLK